MCIQTVSMKSSKLTCLSKHIHTMKQNTYIKKWLGGQETWCSKNVLSYKHEDWSLDSQHPHKTAKVVVLRIPNAGVGGYGNRVCGSVSLLCPPKQQAPGSKRPWLKGKVGWTVTAALHLTPSSGQCEDPTPHVTQEHYNSAHYKYLTVNIYINYTQFIEVKKRGNTIPEVLPGCPSRKLVLLALLCMYVCTWT